MTKWPALIGAAVFVASPIAAVDRIERPPSPPARIQLEAVQLGVLVTLLMRDVMQVPYVIAPDVLADRRPVSVKLDLPRSEIPVRVVHFLRSIGLSVEINGGAVYVSRAGAIAGDPAAPQLALAGSQAAGRQGYGPGASAADPLAADVAIVEPAFRSPTELAQIVQGVYPGLTIALRGGIAPEQSPSGDKGATQLAPQVEPDRLVMSGPAPLIDRAILLLREIDKPRPTVQIRAIVFQVSTSKARGSALSMLADVLGGKLGFGSFQDAAPSDQYVRLSVGGVRAVLSAVKQDGRFQVLAQPSLTALSGSTGSINSGSQVPTLGAVTFNGNGSPPTRSVVYRDSGVSLSVLPVVRRGEIQLSVTQERSTFVKTSTGVNDSPTLNKSTSTVSVAITPGQTVAIAGLDERSLSNTKAGLLGGILGARQTDEESAQLLVLIQADLAFDDRTTTMRVRRLRAGQKSAVDFAPPIGPKRAPQAAR